MCGVGECSLAGMESPVILKSGKKVIRVGAYGMPVGVEPSLWPCDDYQFVLEADDILLMATDGIAEARRGDDLLGFNGMIDLAMRAYLTPGRDTAADVAHAVYEGARAYTGGPLHDDATILTAQRRIPAL